MEKDNQKIISQKVMSEVFKFLTEDELKKLRRIKNWYVKGITSYNLSSKKENNTLFVNSENDLVNLKKYNTVVIKGEIDFFSDFSNVKHLFILNRVGNIFNCDFTNIVEFYINLPELSIPILLLKNMVNLKFLSLEFFSYLTKGFEDFIEQKINLLKLDFILKSSFNDKFIDVSNFIECVLGKKSSCDVSYFVNKRIVQNSFLPDIERFIEKMYNDFEINVKIYK